MRRFGALLCTAALGLGFAAGAQAHAHLAQSVPAANSTVRAAPAALSLKFSESLELAFSGLTVTDARKAKVATGPARLAAGDEATLVVPLAGALPPGAYAVQWHVVAKDGHKTHGNYGFTVQP